MALSDTRKWQISIFSGLLFIIISSKMTYKLTDSLFKMISLPSTAALNGCPTDFGLFAHTLVFVLVTKLSMK